MYTFLILMALIIISTAARDGLRVAVQSLIAVPLAAMVWFGLSAVFH